MFQDFLTVLLCSRQAQALAAFYRDTMRLPPVPGFVPGQSGRALFAAGKTGRIRVQGPAAGLPEGPTALWVEAAYVDNTYKAVREEGKAPLLVDLTDTYYGAREFQVLDPAGNITCVINYAADLPKRREEAGPALYGDEFRAVLYVKNLAACRRFYTGVLGLEIVYEWEENRGDRGCKYALCPGGHAYIETLFREPLAVQRKAVLALAARDVEACYRAVCARAGGAVALPLGPDVQGRPGFGLWDPDGNLVLVWQQDQ